MAGHGHFDGGYERRYGGIDDRDRDFGRGDHHIRSDRPGAIGGPRESEWERGGPTGLLRRAGQDAPSLPGGVIPRLEDRNMGAGAGPALRGPFPGDEPGAYRRDFPRGYYDDIRDLRDRGEGRFAGREPPREMLREPRDLRDLGPSLRDPRDLGPLRDPRDMGLPPRDLLPSRDILLPREDVDRFTAASRMSGGSISGLGLDMSSLTSLSGVGATLASLSSTLPSLGVMEPIVRGQCLLLPPVGGPSEPSPGHKPDYCKTVFVGHLPQNTTRQSLYDIFDACGKIASIRLNQRSHFAHIQFETEDAVDKAMDLNNYSIKVDLSGDLGSMGKIIVDFAVSRGDVGLVLLLRHCWTQ